MSDDLATFLLVRYDEAKQRARAAITSDDAVESGLWASDGDLVYALKAPFGHPRRCEDEPDHPGLCTDRALVSSDDDGTKAVLAHIARHDPAWVLADVAAKRRIVELHGHRPEQAWDGSTLTGDCRECTDEHYPCATLRLLGLEHADHPDYREEWKP